MEIEAKQFQNLESLHDAVVALLKDTLQQESEMPRATLLSGGNTPLPIYRSIADHPFSVAPNVYVAFTDERHVSLTDSANNYAQTKPMLSALAIGEDRILHVDTSLSLTESARQYHNSLHHFMENGGHFSLAILGLGADGHTCSLFTDEHLIALPGALAVPIEKDTLPHRVSVTTAVLRQVETIIFLAAGESKRAVIKAFLGNPESLVAGKAVHDARHVSVWYTMG